MKIIPKVTALLIASVFLFSLTSCGYTGGMTERVNNYLEKEYPENSFDIIDYEKHNTTSGRYEVNLRCREDGVSFRMFVYSSISVTDSYSVERANSAMADIIYNELGTKLGESFKSLVWHDIYADNATNYRFREIELKEEFSLADVTSLHRVTLDDNIDEAKIGAHIYDFVYALCDDYSNGCALESVSFTYKIGRTTYTFTSDSESVLNLGKDGVIHLVLTNISDPSKKEVSFEYFSAGTVEEPSDIPEENPDPEGKPGEIPTGKSDDPQGAL